MSSGKALESANACVFFSPTAHEARICDHGQILPQQKFARPSNIPAFAKLINKHMLRKWSSARSPVSN